MSKRRKRLSDNSNKTPENRFQAEEGISSYSQTEDRTVNSNLSTSQDADQTSKTSVFESDEERRASWAAETARNRDMGTAEYGHQDSYTETESIQRTDAVYKNATVKSQQNPVQEQMNGSAINGITDAYTNDQPAQKNNPAASAAYAQTYESVNYSQASHYTQDERMTGVRQDDHISNSQTENPATWNKTESEPYVHTEEPEPHGPTVFNTDEERRTSWATENARNQAMGTAGYGFPQPENSTGYHDALNESLVQDRNHDHFAFSLNENGTQALKPEDASHAGLPTDGNAETLHGRVFSSDEERRRSWAAESTRNRENGTAEFGAIPDMDYAETGAPYTYGNQEKTQDSAWTDGSENQIKYARGNHITQTKIRDDFAQVGRMPLQTAEMVVQYHTEIGQVAGQVVRIGRSMPTTLAAKNLMTNAMIDSSATMTEIRFSALTGQDLVLLGADARQYRNALQTKEYNSYRRLSETIRPQVNEGSTLLAAYRNFALSDEELRRIGITQDMLEHRGSTEGLAEIKTALDGYINSVHGNISTQDRATANKAIHILSELKRETLPEVEMKGILDSLDDKDLLEAGLHREALMAYIQGSGRGDAEQAIQSALIDDNVHNKTKEKLGNFLKYGAEQDETAIPLSSIVMPKFGKNDLVQLGLTAEDIDTLSARKLKGGILLPQVDRDRLIGALESYMKNPAADDNLKKKAENLLRLIKADHAAAEKGDVALRQLRTYSLIYGNIRKPNLEARMKNAATLYRMPIQKALGQLNAFDAIQGAQLMRNEANAAAKIFKIQRETFWFGVGAIEMLTAGIRRLELSHERRVLRKAKAKEDAKAAKKASDKIKKLNGKRGRSPLRKRLHDALPWNRAKMAIKNGFTRLNNRLMQLKFIRQFRETHLFRTAARVGQMIGHVFAAFSAVFSVLFMVIGFIIVLVVISAFVQISGQGDMEINEMNGGVKKAVELINDAQENFNTSLTSMAGGYGEVGGITYLPPDVNLKMYPGNDDNFYMDDDRSDRDEDSIDADEVNGNNEDATVNVPGLQNHTVFEYPNTQIGTRKYTDTGSGITAMAAVQQAIGVDTDVNAILGWASTNNYFSFADGCSKDKLFIAPTGGLKQGNATTNINYILAALQNRQPVIVKVSGTAFGQSPQCNAGQYKFIYLQGITTNGQILYCNPSYKGRRYLHRRCSAAVLAANMENAFVFENRDGESVDESTVHSSYNLTNGREILTMANIRYGFDLSAAINDEDMPLESYINGLFRASHPVDTTITTEYRDDNCASYGSGTSALGFTKEQFINAVANVYQTAHNNGYQYGNSQATPPTTDGIISCDRLIAKALWDLGMTDQSTGGITCGNMGAYLESHGFEKSTSFDDIGYGSIVLVKTQTRSGRWTSYWAHTFVVVSFDPATKETTKYDTGSQTRIESVQPFVNEAWAYKPDDIEVYNIPETSATSQTSATGTSSQEISLDPSWEYASYSKINSGHAVLYTADASINKGKTVCVNAGHGTSGGGNVYTQCHPDGTPKVTGGSTAEGETEAQAVSSGTTFSDGTPERNATLSLAIKVKNKLLADGYNVLMIRETDDVQLDNIARTVIANNNADCHVALHYDSTTSDKGAYYVGVPDVGGYRSMEPVASHWQSHEALGQAVIEGMRAAGVKIWNGSNATDLTQTSYSTIPSVDIEVGDRGTDYGDATQETMAAGIAAGIESYLSGSTVAPSQTAGTTYYCRGHQVAYLSVHTHYFDKIFTDDVLGIAGGSFGTINFTTQWGVSTYGSDSNYARVGNYLIQIGFSPAAAAGMLGNAAQESGGAGTSDINPADAEGRVCGIFQFTGGNYTRYMNWCAQRGKNWIDIEPQCDFLKECILSDDWMLESEYSSYVRSGVTAQEFMQMTDPEEAAAVFCAYYERCHYSDSHLEDVRKPFARAAYSALLSSITPA